MCYIHVYLIVELALPRFDTVKKQGPGPNTILGATELLSENDRQKTWRLERIHRQIPHQVIKGQPAEET